MTSETNRNYCMKGEQTHAEWNEHHDDGPTHGRNYVGFEKGDFPSNQGKRSDLDAMKEAIKDGMTNTRDLREHHSSAFSGHRRFAIEYIIDHKPPVEIPAHPLRVWQERLVTVLDGPVDPREIIFVVDEKGEEGKSWFAEYYRQRRPLETIVCTPGKKVDMVYAAACHGFDPRVLFLDCPRSKQTRKVGNVTESALMYDFLEEMKNGFIMNTKYESYPWRFPRPHVVVLTNSPPDTDALSEDRYNIIFLNQRNYPIFNPPEQRVYPSV